jgi:hypothetical protein
MHSRLERNSHSLRLSHRALAACLQLHSGLAQRRFPVKVMRRTNIQIHHRQFMRASAAVAPNRKLDAGECPSRIPISLFTDIERFLIKHRHFLMMHHHFSMMFHHFLMIHHHFLMMHHHFLMMHHYFLMISPSLFDDVSLLFDDASLLFDGITITF